MKLNAVCWMILAVVMSAPTWAQRQVAAHQAPARVKVEVRLTERERAQQMLDRFTFGRDPATWKR